VRRGSRGAAFGLADSAGQTATNSSKRAGMRYKTIAFILIVLTAAHLAEAQQPTKVPRIGLLVPSSSDSTRRDAFLQGLRDLGYVEGKNIVIEYRYTEGELNRLSDLAAELVRLNVDVIVTAAISSVRAAKKATATIPIVFASVGDAVDSGLVSSLARPGGNATGLTFLAPELDGKRLELLKEAFPKVTRVAFLWRVPAAREDLLKDAEPVAKTLGLRLQSVGVKGPDDFESAFKAAKSGGADALIVISNPLSNTYRARIVDLAAKNRLPGIYPSTDFVEDGGLMSYGADILDNWRRAATYLDKILKGAKPADLPVEQPTKFEFVINLKTAKQIGVTIPPTVLARADKVIK
jgi:putative tryptophan/tyrosine transport system substrate-binding protein